VEPSWDHLDGAKGGRQIDEAVYARDQASPGSFGRWLRLEKGLVVQVNERTFESLIDERVSKKG